MMALKYSIMLTENYNIYYASAAAHIIYTEEKGRNKKSHLTCLLYTYK